MRERRTGLSWITLAILLLACIAVQGVGIVEASPEKPKVYVDPQTIKTAPDETFNVSITVTGITEEESLYGWEFTLGFDPSILEVARHIVQHPPGPPGPPVPWNETVYHVYEGPFLETVNETLFIWQNTTGTVNALCMIKFPYPPQGAVGSGVLATIEFRVKTEGATLLHFEYTELDTLVGENPVLIDHQAFDGFFGARDLAVTAVAASHVHVKVGDSVTINVTATNEGDFPETFSVTAYYFNGTLSDVTIGPPQVFNLDPGESQFVAFVWNTSNVGLGTYTIKANATIPPGDTNTTNNEHIDGTVTIARFNVFDHTVEVGGVTFHVIIKSNSTVSNFHLIPEIKEIRFNVTELSDTVGFCNVTIPLDLLGNPYTVQVDGLLITPEETTNGTHSFLYFTYDHNIQSVKINGATVATPPSALFTPSTASAYVGDQVTFNASASEDPDGEIVIYQWDFGDGTPLVTETDPIATHVYASADNYPVTLTVTDNQDLTDTATGTVTISQKHDVAVVDVTPFPSEVTVGKLVSINVTVANQGTETETFNITVYYNNTIIETKSVTNLASDASKTLTIDWETTEIDSGTYAIKAVASTTADDIDITNNELIGDTITIKAQETPAPGILLYVAAAGAAIIIMAAIAFYFLRIRKPKPA